MQKSGFFHAMIQFSQFCLVPWGVVVLVKSARYNLLRTTKVFSNKFRYLNETLGILCFVGKSVEIGKTPKIILKSKRIIKVASKSHLRTGYRKYDEDLLFKKISEAGPISWGQTQDDSGTNGPQHDQPTTFTISIFIMMMIAPSTFIYDFLMPWKRERYNCVASAERGMANNVNNQLLVAISSWT